MNFGSTAPLVLAASDETRDFAQFDVPYWAWIALIALIVVMLVFDLLVVHRTAHVITLREAAIESAVWISIGLAYGAFLAVWQGGGAASEY
jgi:tellurite resistance protein TerC